MLHFSFVSLGLGFGCIHLKETSSWINLSSLISISYAIINELSQAFIPQRFPSIGDLLMNLLGVILAIVVHEQIRKSTSSFT